MNPIELEEFLFDQIPLARALQVSVTTCTIDSAELRAPLEPNRNHLGTAFGGSLGAILILSGYTWLYNVVSMRGFNCHILLKKSDVEYFHPVETEIVALTRAPDTSEIEKFMDAFKRKGTARIVVKSAIAGDKGPACIFEGEFVAKIADNSRLG